MLISHKHIQNFAKWLCGLALLGVMYFGYLHLRPTSNSPHTVDGYKAYLQEQFERKIYGVDKLPVEKPRSSQQASAEKPSAPIEPSRVEPFPEIPETRNVQPEKLFASPQLSQNTLLERAGYLAYPPSGLSLGVISAKIFYPLQQRYVDVAVNLIFNAQGVYLYGAAMYEIEKDGKVLLVPCIFMQEIPFSEQTKRLVSPLEQELSTAIQISKELEFYPWARYATSYLDCQEHSQKFRVSIQFGSSNEDIFISLAVPFSIDDKNALFDLADKSEFPCSGLEIFFDTLDLSELLLKSLQVKNKYINKEITLED